MIVGVQISCCRRSNRQEVADNHGGTILRQQCTRWELLVCTHMLWVSRRIVNEKQHRSNGSLEVGSGVLSEQLVRMAF